MSEDFAFLINSGQTEKAIESFSPDKDPYMDFHFNVERKLITALKIKECPKEIIDAGVDCFFKAHPRRHLTSTEHNNWVISLSRFSKYLWERDYKDLIRELNSFAFNVAYVDLDFLYCDYLVKDFESYAKWNTVPLEYGYRLTGQLDAGLDWLVRKKHLAYAISRIKNSPFKTEADSIRFDLENWIPHFTKTLPRTRRYLETKILDLKHIKKMIERLQQLDKTSSSFPSIEESLRVFLEHCKNKFNTPCGDEWNIRSIEITNQMLNRIVTEKK